MGKSIRSKIVKKMNSRQHEKYRSIADDRTRLLAAKLREQIAETMAAEPTPAVVPKKDSMEAEKKVPEVAAKTDGKVKKSGKKKKVTAAMILRKSFKKGGK
eukprot:TRINITY_DN20062_c0_g1_i1.p1 TRINITY_DN20062_c0_g1~~TRINITY_DN20062_c0_g1_i1.p1  ORF type:complete len:101 (-),score=28.69 TRINITY_DN20062_c0_g1_i1:188-490(-)